VALSRPPVGSVRLTLQVAWARPAGPIEPAKFSAGHWSTVADAPLPVQPRGRPGLEFQFDSRAAFKFKFKFKVAQGDGPAHCTVALAPAGVPIRL
jgi:hypothetical protein